MSLAPYIRKNLTWAARPPGPASFWYAVGTVVRRAGRLMDAAGEFRFPPAVTAHMY